MLDQIIKDQKKYFNQGHTRDIEKRIAHLKALKTFIQVNEQEILDALLEDLGKPYFEGYATEVGYVLESISFTLKHLHTWTKDEKVKAPIHQIPSTSFVRYEPYGIAGIIAPFNYPFQLLLEPMIGAIAAGNTVIAKPSEYTPKTTALIQDLVHECFPPEYVSVITGDRSITKELIHAPVDYLFFTGSVPVGKIVMRAASERLTPITLELGGKSPTIVHRDANLPVAAKRIAWGKFINTGQTCIAPDYVYVHESVKEAFLGELEVAIQQFYGENPLLSDDYGKIVNERHYDRLIQLLDQEKIVIGGEVDRDTLFIAPTVMENVTWDDPVMADEIFGPILPILTYSDLNDTLNLIGEKPKPLALYLFSESDIIQKIVVDKVQFGGGCINDTLTHMANPNMPFGGVGSSGMGRYHGYESFLTFSHKKAIHKKSTRIETGLVFPPYKNKIKLVKKILK
jgi:aldehyde dehydrogenase (NAD+)